MDERARADGKHPCPRSSPCTCLLRCGQPRAPRRKCSPSPNYTAQVHSVSCSRGEAEVRSSKQQRAAQMKLGRFNSPDQVHTVREEINRRLLGSNIIDTDLGVGHAAAIDRQKYERTMLQYHFPRRASSSGMQRESTTVRTGRSGTLGMACP